MTPSLLLAASFAPAVAAIVIILMSAIAGWRSWHGWAGHNPEEFRRIWGPNHSEALMRAMPSFSVSGILLALLVLDLAYVNDTSLSETLRTAITAALGALLALSLIVSASVLLVSRPRRFVPPTRRRSKSLTRSWIDKRK